MRYPRYGVGDHNEASGQIMRNATQAPVFSSHFPPSFTPLKMRDKQERTKIEMKAASSRYTTFLTLWNIKHVACGSGKHKDHGRIPKLIDYICLLLVSDRWIKKHMNKLCKYEQETHVFQSPHEVSCTCNVFHLSLFYWEGIKISRLYT